MTSMVRSSLILRSA